MSRADAVRFIGMIEGGHQDIDVVLNVNICSLIICSQDTTGSCLLLHVPGPDSSIKHFASVYSSWAVGVINNITACPVDTR